MGFLDVGLERPLRADFAAVGDAELLLDEILGRETVTVPAPAAFDALAVHSPEARYGVLDDTRKQGAMMRGAGNERWAVIKDIRIIDVATINGFFKDVVVLPPLGDGFFIYQSAPAGACFVFHYYIIPQIEAGRNGMYYEIFIRNFKS